MRKKAPFQEEPACGASLASAATTCIYQSVGITIVGYECEIVRGRACALGDHFDAAIAHSGHDDAGMPGRGVQRSGARVYVSADLEIGSGRREVDADGWQRGAFFVNQATR